MIRILLFTLILIIPNVSIAKICTGRLLNPVTDICWDCMFPMSIGSAEMPPSTTFRPDTINYPFPVCVCPKGTPPLPIPGIAIGLWEPVRLVEVTKSPFCMVGMGGMPINPGLAFGSGTESSQSDLAETDFWNVHYYVAPFAFLLELFTNAGCITTGSFDIAYMTEFDPLWQDDELAFLLNPEALLFSNPIAQIACAADCVTSSVWTPLDPLFWCSGCQGSMYPMTGAISENSTTIQSSSLAVSRIVAKLHRQLLAWDTSGPEAICNPIPMPIIKKSQYRVQTAIPVPGIGPYGCSPLGRSKMFSEMFKVLPTVGEDFAYILWRKKNCCFL